MEQASLRERKKAVVMNTVQAVALDLFEADGFDAVTVEQVAARADVSPSTLYRYFGTKEGLVLHDRFDDGALRGLVEQVAAGADPAVAMRAVVEGLFESHFEPTDVELTLRRTRLWLTTPAIHRAGLVMFDEAVELLAAALAQVSPAPLAQARLAVASISWPIMSAIRNWHDAGADPSAWRECLLRALDFTPERIPDWPAPSERSRPRP